MADPNPTTTLADAISAGGNAVARWLEGTAARQQERMPIAMLAEILQTAATYRCSVALEQIGFHLQCVVEVLEGRDGDAS